ncbi:putative transcription factor bZIP family [Helianthus anomalus]
MGTGEERSPAKQSKPTSTQETPPSTYLDWSSSMQTLNCDSGVVPSFFVSSTVTPPVPHPYMWAGQHPMMPPYATPVPTVPYPSVYPPAGVYGHPSMPMPNTEMETKASNGKVKVNKKSKGSCGNVNDTGVRAGESGKTASSSGNDGATQSAESENNGSSDTNNEDTQQVCGSVSCHSTGFEIRSINFSIIYLIYRIDTSRNILEAKREASIRCLRTVVLHASTLALCSYSRIYCIFKIIICAANARNNNPVASMPATTNLYMGMNMWTPPTGSVSQPVAPPRIMADRWVQDERELKRQKRKQDNRESARRSRMRKQAECEALQATVETLNNENHSLRDELQRLSEACVKLTAENDSIKVSVTFTSSHNIYFFTSILFFTSIVAMVVKQGFQGRILPE